VELCLPLCSLCKFLNYCYTEIHRKYTEFHRDFPRFIFIHNPVIVDRLRLLDKEIDPDRSRILFDTIITPDNFQDHFMTHNSQWSVEDGWITGRNPDESAGMAILKQDFPGNILLDFEASTIPPSTHDINFMWNGEWSERLNSCENAYIGSICGWYSNRIGIERSPEYKLVATTPNPDFEPGRVYRIQAGSINGNCFIFIDGRLAIELNDPDPLDTGKYTKVAFTAWKSHIRIRNISIRKIEWTPLTLGYKPEF
jgi:hypothetical protein